MVANFWAKKLAIMVLVATSLTCFGTTVNYIDSKIPDKITIVQNSEEVIPMSLGEDIVVDSDKVGSYSFDVKVFGLISIKKVDVNVVRDQSVYCGGMPIGMYLKTDGIMVIGSGKVSDMQGRICEPSLNMVKEGDYIVKLNGISVNSKSQLVYLVDKYGKEEITLTIRRDKTFFDIKVTPVQTSAEEYKLGIWVRDDTQGIGTITYITEDMRFGALGHGVSDIDTGELLDSSGGVLYKAIVWGIEKGKPNAPGGLCGYINYEEENVLGSIYTNCECGIYGFLTDDYKELTDTEKVKVAYKQDVKTGKAYIRSYVSGKAEDYEIEISKVYANNSGKNKDMVITVTDKRLIELTGGIVQGMSGSPIIQDGKLIGAVTHVFVNNPEKGYGIFIENMLEK